MILTTRAMYALNSPVPNLFSEKDFSFPENLYSMMSATTASHAAITKAIITENLSIPALRS